MGDVFGTNRRDVKQIRAYARVLGEMGPRIGLLARYWHRPGPDRPRLAAVNVFPVSVLEPDVSLEEIAGAAGPDAMAGVTSDRVDIAGASAVCATGLLPDEEGRMQHAFRIAVGLPGWRVMIESYSYDDIAFTDDFIADLIALGNGIGVR